MFCRIKILKIPNLKSIITLIFLTYLPKMDSSLVYHFQTPPLSCCCCCMKLYEPWADSSTEGAGVTQTENDTTREKE